MMGHPGGSHWVWDPVWVGVGGQCVWVWVYLDLGVS